MLTFVVLPITVELELLPDFLWIWLLPSFELRYHSARSWTLSRRLKRKHCVNVANANKSITKWNLKLRPTYCQYGCQCQQIEWSRLDPMDVIEVWIGFRALTTCYLHRNVKQFVFPANLSKCWNSALACNLNTKRNTKYLVIGNDRMLWIVFFTDVC